MWCNFLHKISHLYIVLKFIQNIHLNVISKHFMYTGETWKRRFFYICTNWPFTSALYVESNQGSESSGVKLNIDNECDGTCGSLESGSWNAGSQKCPTPTPRSPHCNLFTSSLPPLDHIRYGGVEMTESGVPYLLDIISIVCSVPKANFTQQAYLGQKRFMIQLVKFYPLDIMICLLLIILILTN